jgi:hypothetical protein
MIYLTCILIIDGSDCGATTLRITTLSIMTLRITTFSIKTLSRRGLYGILSISDSQHSNALPLCQSHYGKGRVLFTVMLSVVAP